MLFSSYGRNLKRGLLVKPWTTELCLQPDLRVYGTLQSALRWDFIVAPYVTVRVSSQLGNVGRLRSWGDVNQTLHCFNKATLTKEWISLSCFSSFYPQGPFPCSTASFHFSHLSVSLCANKCKLHAIVFETAARGTQVFHINLCTRPLNHVSRRGTPHTEHQGHLCVNLNLRRQRTAREKNQHCRTEAVCTVWPPVFLLDTEIIVALIRRWRENKLHDGCPFLPHIYLYPGSAGDAVSSDVFILIFHRMWSEAHGLDGKSINLNIYVMDNDMLKTGGLSLAELTE